MARPDYVTNEHLWFLDDLRESGLINMFGARPSLMKEFPKLGKDTAADILSYWMESFGSETR